MRHIIDLDRYPLDREGSQEWHDMVAAAQAALQQGGMFSLEGFLRPGVAAQAAAEIGPVMASDSYLHQRRHNIYFKPEIPGLAADHPALRQVLAATMGRPALYVMPDPLACANVIAYRAGEALNWHFDRSEFTTTLLLQAPEQGGDFEYRTNLRTDTDPNYDGVAKLLEGRDPEARLLHLQAGTLNVFRGKNTAHRVTPVQGGVDRMIAVLCYYETPGVMFSPEERLGFYGRAG